MKTVLVVGFLVLILYNLGAGLFYMIVDRGTTNRTVNALTWRIGLSIALIALVCAGIASGYIQPHGIYS
jgi:glycerol uptake facilitator-like aquaporin